MRRVVLAVLAASALVLPSMAAADPSTTTAPATTVPPSTMTAPTTAPVATTVSPPTTPPAGETTLAVADEPSFRAALAALSADASGSHSIDLTADITLDDGTDPTYTGTEDLTIDGHGFTMAAGWTSRFLVVDSPADAALTLTAVRMNRGAGGGDGGAVLLLNDSTVTIRDSTFEGNEASGSGGAVEVGTTATVERSDFVDNRAHMGDGGALDAAADHGEFTVVDSNFTANRAFGEGGAISEIGFGSISTETGIHRSTFDGNLAGDGGAIVLGSHVVVANSTFVNNLADQYGGAILADGGSDLSALVYVTATGNIGTFGANLTNFSPDLRVIFSVLGEPRQGDNCSRQAGNLHITESRVDDDSCPGARRVDDLGLGELTDNGGRSLTREPVVGSPLIDAIPAGYGFPSLEGGCAHFVDLDGFDQRGVERPQDGDGRTRTYVYDQTYEVAADCDIGAVEADAVVVPPTGPVAGGPSFTG